MSDWSNFPANLFGRVVFGCEINDVRCIRLVCSNWRYSLDHSIQYIKPKQFKGQKLIDGFPGMQFLNLDDSVPDDNEDETDITCLAQASGLRGLNIRYSQSRGFYDKALKIQAIQAEVLAQLTNLLHLDISGQDEMCWAQMHFLSNLGDLQSLFVENMSKGFDDNCWVSIGKLRELKQLQVGGANTKTTLHLDKITNLCRLETLGIGNMSWTNITQGLQQVQNFHQLMKLDASNCKIQQELDVDHICQAVTLQTLLLRGNELRDPQLMPLANLPKLHHLSIGGTQVCGDILSQLSCLTYLDVSNCAHLDSHPILAYLSSNTSLIQLHMTNCTVQVPIELNEANEPPVAHMLQQGPIPHPVTPPLKVMDLSGTMRAPYIMWRTLLVEGIQLDTLLLGKSSDAVDAFVNFLQYQKQLRVLNLASCLTTHRCLGAVARMPQLEQLNVNFCALDTDNLIYSLNGCTNLKSLEMQKGKNIDAGLSLLSLRFPTLQKLNLSHCQTDFTDLGIASIAALTNLTELRMSYCKKISDIGFYQMSKALTKLKILDLEGCTISDLGFQNFGCLRGLEMLEISHCSSLSGQVVPIICGLCSLKSLYMEHMEQIFVQELKPLGSCQSLTQLVINRILPDGFMPLWINVR